MNEFLSMKSRGNKMTNRERTAAFLSAAAKYAKGFILGALTIITFNSYNHIIQVSQAPVMEPLGQFIEEKTK